MIYLLWLMKISIVCVIIWGIHLAMPRRVLAHREFVDEVYGELNDYLQMFQFLEARLPGANRAMEKWRELHDAAWELRRLTDEVGLDIHADEALAQLQTLNALRDELVGLCREILQEATRTKPTVEIDLTSWGLNLRSMPQEVVSDVGTRDGILIVLRNVLRERAEIELRAEYSNGIWVWQKVMRLEPESTRYAMAYLDSPESGELETVITVVYGDQKVDVPIRVSFEGPTEPPTETDTNLTGRIAVKIIDAETGEPVAARVEICGEDGSTYTQTVGTDPSYVVASEGTGWHTPLWDFNPRPFFYSAGEFTLAVRPGKVEIRIHKGFEYEPFRTEIDVSPDEPVEMTCALKRWIHMPKNGWYSGETHIHTTQVGVPVLFTRHWPIVPRAEGLNVTNILTLKGEWRNLAIYANEYPMGHVEWASTEDSRIYYGEEYRHNPYGHLCFLNINEVVEPISTGTLGELGNLDYPPNADACDWAHEQGGTVIAPHMGLDILSGKPIVTRWPSTGYEMPIDVALGKIEVAEIYGVSGGIDVWYKLLNCGFRLPATAGPDWVIRDCPRVYVHLDGEFSFENWLDGLKKGRTFATQGPMLFCEINGLPLGEEIRLEGDSPQAVHVKAHALVGEGVHTPIEIVVNGQVVLTGETIDQELQIDQSCWLAARCEGAHTSPYYVVLNDEPISSKSAAQEFVNSIECIVEWVRTKGVFETDAQRQRVIDLFRQAQEIYRSM